MRNVIIPLDEDSLRPRCSASMLLSRLLFNVGFYNCRRTATDSRAAALLLLRTTVFWTTAVRHTGVGTITYGSENAARSIKNAECARVALTLSRGRSPWCTGLVVVYSRSFSIGFYYFFFSYSTRFTAPPRKPILSFHGSTGKCSLAPKNISRRPRSRVNCIHSHTLYRYKFYFNWSNNFQTMKLFL